MLGKQLFWNAYLHSGGINFPKTPAESCADR